MAKAQNLDCGPNDASPYMIKPYISPYGNARMDRRGWNELEDLKK